MPSYKKVTKKHSDINNGNYYKNQYICTNIRIDSVKTINT